MEKVVKEVKSIVDDLDMSMYFDEEQMDNEILYYEGHKAGVAEGRRDGLAEGKKVGHASGLKDGKIEIAKNLLKKNMDNKFIQEVTGLSKEEIEELAKES